MYAVVMICLKFNRNLYSGGDKIGKTIGIDPQGEAEPTQAWSAGADARTGLSRAAGPAAAHPARILYAPDAEP